tara:strand:- start:450 stop:551 length:102 start_codon:yes stop_codon:yes gene_type:complete
VCAIIIIGLPGLPDCQIAQIKAQQQKVLSVLLG